MDPTSMAKAMVKNLPEKTGKTLEEWIKILKSHMFLKHGEIVKYLRQEYSLTHGYANMIAFKYREKL